MQRVDLHDLGDMLEQPWLATMATHRKDGSVLLSAVWWEWDGDALWVSVPEGDIKDRHLVLDPRVSISLAEEASYPGRGLEIGGVAERHPDAGGEGLRRIATRYLGKAVADEWMTQFADVAWILLRIAPTRVRAWDHLDEPLLRQAEPQWPARSGSA